MSEHLDPLDERADAEAEVRDKRLLEELDRDNEGVRLAQLLENEGLRDYLWSVISKCGTLNEPWDPNYGKVSYNCGRQSIGRMLIADINLANPQAWLEMQLKAGRVTAAAARAEALKRLRKAR
jgi:hypothetical protein